MVDVVETRSPFCITSRHVSGAVVARRGSVGWLEQLSHVCYLFVHRAIVLQTYHYRCRHLIRSIDINIE